MENPVYNQFAARFAASSISSLLESFNSEVGNYGWNSTRSFHDAALVDELIRRGIDVSAVYDGKKISFAHHVKLVDNRLVISE